MYGLSRKHRIKYAEITLIDLRTCMLHLFVSKVVLKIALVIIKTNENESVPSTNCVEQLESDVALILQKRN